MSPAVVRAEEALVAGQNDFVGIGTIARPIRDGDVAVVISVLPDSPAAAGRAPVT